MNSVNDQEAPPASVGHILGAWGRDILVATRVLTRLPLPIGPDASEEAIARARRAFPIVGLGLGLAGGLAYAFCMAVNLSAFPSAFLTFGVLILLTGARAEVALAAFWEGIGRGGDVAARRAIMAEERLGYYGVLALFFSIILRSALLAVMVRSGPAAAVLIAAMAGSRAVVPLICDRFPPPAGESLGGLASGVGRDQIWVGAALGALFVLLFLGPLAGVLAAAVALGAAWGFALFVQRRIGGFNLSALATVQQVAEIGILLIGAAFT